MELPVALTNFLDKSIEQIYAFGPVFEPTVVLGEYHQPRLRWARAVVNDTC